MCAGRTWDCQCSYREPWPLRLKRQGRPEPRYVDTPFPPPPPLPPHTAPLPPPPSIFPPPLPLPTLPLNLSYMFLMCQLYWTSSSSVAFCYIILIDIVISFVKVCLISRLSLWCTVCCLWSRLARTEWKKWPQPKICIHGRSINQSTNQPTNHPNNQPTNQSSD